MGERIDFLRPEIRKEQRTIEQLLLAAGKSKDNKATGKYLREAYGIMDCSEARGIYQPQEIVSAIIAAKIVNEIKDLNQPRKRLENVLRLKINQEESLSDFIDDPEELKQKCVGLYFNSSLQRIIQGTQHLIRQRGRFNLGVVQQYEIIKGRIEKELGVEEAKKADKDFYGMMLPMFVNYIVSSGQKILPSQKEGYQELNGFYLYLREQFKEVMGQVPTMKSVRGNKEILMDEIFYSSLANNLQIASKMIQNKPKQAEELLTYCSELLQSGQDLLYQNALVAAKQKQEKEFNLFSTGFIRFSEKLNLVKEGEETPPEEMEELRQKYFSS